jgi:uncharacterized phage-associated protein
MSEDQRDKIGNLLVKLSSEVPNLYLTKLLKLLFLIDETSVKEIGTPVTWLKYKAWEMGPVAKTIYQSLKFYDGEKFEEYINLNVNSKNHIRITAKKEFCEDKFSIAELRIINRLIEKHKNDTSKKLIELTHKKGGLWDTTCVNNNLHQKFDKFDQTSPFDIDFEDALENEFDKYFYNVAKENREFFNDLKYECYV